MIIAPNGSKNRGVLNTLEINAIRWKEFFIGGEDGVFIISSGKRLTTANMDSGIIPFIGATDSNNGITNYINTPNKTLDNNLIGVNYNGSVGETFYHPYYCVFSDDVKRLHIKRGIENKYIYLFLVTIIKKQKEKFTYGYKFNANRMSRQIVMLPIDENEQPNWSFMERYSKAIICRKYSTYMNFVNQA